MFWVYRIGSLTAAVILGLGLSGGAPALAEAHHLVAVRASAAIESFGLNTHVNYLDSAYAHFDQVQDALKYVGINNLRELAPMPWFSGAAPLGYYSRLMQEGYSIDFVVPGGKVDLDKSFGPILDLANGPDARISAIEGFNEVDHGPVSFDGQTGNDGAIKGQEAIYALTHREKPLRGIPVIDLTGVSAAPTALNDRADFGNAHLYPQNGVPPDGSFRGMHELAEKVHVPMMVTEFGYASLPQSGWLVIGVDENAQAKGVAAGLLSSIENGFARTYLYELVDERPDPSGKDRESHYGLFDNQFRKKPAAIAVHNLTQLLRDSGAQADHFALHDVDVDIAGLPKTAHVVAIEKSDGSIWLAMWDEVPFWDNQHGTPIPDRSTSVTILLPKGTRVANIYALQSPDPQIKHVEAAPSVGVDVSSSPILIEFRP